VTLRVFGARIGTRDPHALDITRASGVGDGLALAPSWAILRPALDARERSERLRATSPEEAAREWSDAWQRYREAFVAEMRESYRRDRGPWQRLLARERVVLVCYCPDAEHCHRALLGRVILPALGATWCGELHARSSAAAK
jgi:hypothetical protein